MSLGPLVVLVYVHKQEFFARVGPALHVGHVGFLDLFLWFVDQLQELRRMGHFSLPPANAICSENNTGSAATRVPGSIRSGFTLSAHGADNSQDHSTLRALCFRFVCGIFLGK